MMNPMRRIAAILCILALSGVASGGLDYLHRGQHQDQANAWLAAVSAAAKTKIPALPSRPEDSNCLVCVVLHMVLAAEGAVAPILTLTLLAIAGRLLPLIAADVRIPIRIECRGPPN
jgi:hypothetical protein